MMNETKDIQDAQHEMLLKQAIAELERVKKKLQTLLTYHKLSVKLEKNNSGNSKDSFTV